MTNIAETIRQAVAANQGPEELTVVRFSERREGVSPVSRKSSFLDDDDDFEVPDPIGEATEAYTFAALYVAGRWYLTGVAAGQTRIMKHRDFMERLASDRVTYAEVASAWEVAK